MKGALGNNVASFRFFYPVLPIRNVRLTSQKTGDKKWILLNLICVEKDISWPSFKINEMRRRRGALPSISAQVFPCWFRWEIERHFKRNSFFTVRELSSNSKLQSWCFEKKEKRNGGLSLMVSFFEHFLSRILKIGIELAFVRTYPANKLLRSYKILDRNQIEL